MITLSLFRNCRIRTNFLLGLGAHLGINGILVLLMYYLVTHLSAQQARELLGWAVPVAQGCCFFAAISFTVGLTRRDSDGPEEELAPFSWMIRKITPFGGSRPVAAKTGRTNARRAAEVDTTLTSLKKLDWKVFRDLSIAYFTELGFRVVDLPERANGVDFLLYAEDDYRAVAVRCLPWGTEQVDLKQVRSWQRSMLLAGATEGVLLTTGAFDEEALGFGAGKSLELLGGEEFARRLLALPREHSQRLLAEAEHAQSVRRENRTARPCDRG